MIGRNESFKYCSPPVRLKLLVLVDPECYRGLTVVICRCKDCDPYHQQTSMLEFTSCIRSVPTCLN